MEVALRQDRDRPMSLVGGAVHLQHEVRAGLEIPLLEHCGVPGRLQLPGDPASPEQVGAGIADEEVTPAAAPRLAVAIAHL